MGLWDDLLTLRRLSAERYGSGCAMKLRRLRNIVLGASVVVLLVVAFLGGRALKNHQVEAEMEEALTLATFKKRANPNAPKKLTLSLQTILKLQAAEFTPEATNRLLALGPDVVPILLKWSSAKEPASYKIANPVLQWIGKPLLSSDPWTNKEKALIVARIVQQHAAGAVTVLTNRLKDPDPKQRRFSIHLLGAIGPSIGMEAFRHMTNALQDPDKNVRNDVVWTLQYNHRDAYKSEILIPVFIAGLQDTNHLAQENARTGLKRLLERDAHSRRLVITALRGSKLTGERYLLDPWELEMPEN